MIPPAQEVGGFLTGAVMVASSSPTVDIFESLLLPGKGLPLGIFQDILDWVLNFFLFGIFNFLAGALASGLEMFLYWEPNACLRMLGAAPSCSRSSSFVGMSTLYDRTVYLFISILLIGGLSQAISSMLFPEQQKTTWLRWSRRAFAALIAVIAGKALLFQAISTVNSISMFLFPTEFNLQVGLGGFWQMMEATAVSGLAAVIVLLLISKVTAVMVIGLIFGLVFRLLIIYSVYSTFPLWMGLWVTDTGPMKYGHVASQMAFKAFSVFLIMGLLLGALLATSAAMAGGASYAQQADAQTTGEMAMASEPRVQATGDNSGRYDSMQEGGSGGGSGGGGGGACATPSAGAMSYAVKNCQSNPIMKVGAFLAGVIGVPLIVLRMSKMVLGAPSPSGGDGGSSSGSEGEESEDFDPAKDGHERLTTQAIGGAKELSGGLGSALDSAATTLQEGNVGESVLGAMGNTADSFRSSVRDGASGALESVRDGVENTADAFKEGNGLQLAKNKGIDAGSSAAKGTWGGMKKLDSSARWTATTMNRSVADNLRAGAGHMRKNALWEKDRTPGEITEDEDPMAQIEDEVDVDWDEMAGGPPYEDIDPTDAEDTFEAMQYDEEEGEYGGLDGEPPTRTVGELNEQGGELSDHLPDDVDEQNTEIDIGAEDSSMELMQIESENGHLGGEKDDYELMAAKTENGAMPVYSRDAELNERVREADGPVEVGGIEGADVNSWNEDQDLRVNKNIHNAEHFEEATGTELHRDSKGGYANISLTGGDHNVVEDSNKSVQRPNQSSTQETKNLDTSTRNVHDGHHSTTGRSNVTPERRERGQNRRLWGDPTGPSDSSSSTTTTSSSALTGSNPETSSSSSSTPERVVFNSDNPTGREPTAEETEFIWGDEKDLEEDGDASDLFGE